MSHASFAIVIETISGLTCGVAGAANGEMEPELHSSHYKAKQEILEAVEEGIDVDGWSAEAVTVEGDFVVLVSNGKKFNWKEGL
jgi:hypothetical protein